MLPDYHLHTKRCRHAFGEMLDYVRTASEKGFTEIGFADHAPTDPNFDPQHRMTFLEFPDYVDDILKLRNRFEKPTIRLGIEVDLHPGFESYLETLHQNYPVEYVVGSVHQIDGHFVFATDQVDFPRKKEQQMIRRYFSLIEHAVRSGSIDVMGHFDVLKWIFPHAGAEIVAMGSKVLDVAAQKGVVLELNTSGLRKLPGEMYPGPQLLDIAYQLKIPVCLGSDAHRPREVGSHFDKAMLMLRKRGYGQKTIWKGLQVYVPDGVSTI